MTTSHAAHAKDRANFGGWRAKRPFWGGLFLIVSGLELYISGNLQLALEVHFGPTGFLSYVLPLMMLLCGALTWLSPQQRLFYGILGTVTALYSLIGLNFGGFFLGTVLGLVGGGLAVAWAAPAPAVTDSEAPAESSESTDEMYYQDSRLDDIMAEDETTSAPAYSAPSHPAPWPPVDAYERPPSGVLRDEIPTNQVSPLHGRREGNGAGSADEQLPPAVGPDDLPKRRYLGPLLLAIALTVSLVALSNQDGGGAYAAPGGCPSTSPKPGTSAGSTTPGASPRSEEAATTPPASPTPSPTKAEEGSKGLLGWLGGLFGGGDDDKDKQASAAEASQPAVAAAESTPAAPATSAVVKPSTAKPSSTPACALTSASPVPNDKKAQIAAGQPFVAKVPSILKADVMTMDGLTYDGVADLPHKDGTTVKVLVFSMKNSVSTPFELDTPGGPGLVTTSSKLTVDGDVKFYTTRFTANVLGLLPLTFTPSFPPPPIPLPGFYTACNIELVYVQSNTLTAPALSIEYAD